MHYRNRLSGPILDRIDLYSSVHEIDHEKQACTQAADHAVRSGSRSQARQHQAQRFRSAGKLNTDMTNADIKQMAGWSPEAIQVLERLAARNLTCRPGPTCAPSRSPAPSPTSKTSAIVQEHLAEALNYRPVPRKPGKMIIAFRLHYKYNTDTCSDIRRVMIANLTSDTSSVKMLVTLKSTTKETQTYRQIHPPE